MQFRIVLSNGRKLPFAVNVKTDDADVAAYQAGKKLGLKVSHAIPA
jgi:hypothetical protein